MEAENVNKSAESQINIVIGNLLEAAADKNDTVRITVKRALKKIAKKYPNDVLITSCNYLQKNPKIASEHVISLLQPMEEICLEHIIEIDGDTILLLITFCINEMTRSIEYIPNVQMILSSILVAIGKKHCIQVMEGILSKLVHGVVPHYTIPHTMGALASINAFGVLPFLKSILELMLPMLGMLKTDTIRQSFAYAFGCFCEAINEYMSNIKNAPDPTIQKDSFSTEIGIAYEVLFSWWVHSRESKVSEAVLQALGPMFSILSAEKVTENTPKLINTLLLMFKRHKDQYMISQCLASVLLDILTLNKVLLEPHIDSIFNTLNEIICPVPEYATYEVAKNNSEVLRCYDRIASCFCDRTVDNLIHLLKSGGDKDKIKALIVMTHLVNSSDSVVKSRIPDLIVALKPVLGEHNLRLRIVLLKTIVAFAYHGHLLNSEGSVHVEFIVKLCCSHNLMNSRGLQEIEVTEWNEMLRTCDNSLYLITTSVLELENILWCLFLDCLLNKGYTNASCILLKCLTCLAARKQERMKVDSTETTCITNASLVFARCLALLANPCQAGRGPHVLNFLRHFSCHIHKHLPPFWEERIPRLLTYLKERDSPDVPFNSADWEQLVLDFLKATIREVDESKWTEDLVRNLLDQMSLYDPNTLEKELTLKYFGTALCHVTNPDYVKQKLDLVVDSFKYCNALEAGAYAKAMSMCSRTHFQIVLNKLNVLRKEELLKKSNKFLHFNFIKDTKHEVEVEKVRYTLLLCYTELVLEVSGDKIFTTIENEILSWVMQELQNTRDFQIKRICLLAIGNVARSMHPTNNTQLVRLHSRDEVLTAVLGQLQLHSGPDYIELIPAVLPVLTSLVELRNDLNSQQRVYILETCFDTVYNAAAIYCKLGSPSANGTAITYGDLKLAPFVYNSFERLNALVRSILQQNVSPGTLDEILTQLEPWLSKKRPEQRLPATENLKSVLSIYLANMKFTYEVPGKYGQTGFILGRVVPRCTDSYTNIRLYALECVNLILCIAAKYEGYVVEHNSPMNASLTALKSEIETSDPKLLYNVTMSIATIISNHLPQFQLVHFTESLLDGLLDLDTSSSSGCSVVMHTFFKAKGAELYTNVQEIIGRLLTQMSTMACNKTRNSSIRAVFSMAEHHPKAVAGVLLTQPLPYEKHVSDCWIMLAQEQNLSLDLLEQFKHVFNTILFYEEQPNTEYSKIANVQPLAALCALHDMFHNSKMYNVVLSQLPDLIAVLLIILSSYVNVSPPIHLPQSNKKEKFGVVINRDSYKLIPTKIALDSLKMCLYCAKLDSVADALANHSNMENCTSFMVLLELMAPLAASIFQNAPHIVSSLVTALQPYTSSNLEPQRIAAYGFYVEVLKHKGNGQSSLNEMIVKTFLNGQTDSSEIVRLLVLRGLSYVSDLDEEQKAKHSGFIFSTLLQGLNDLEICNSEINIPLEALIGFSKMLHSVDEKQLESVQISAAVRIKAFFEKDDPLLRAAAFRMLGDLSKSFEKSARLEAFREQVNGNFICLLLHLSDENEEVVKACKYALRQVTPILQAPNVNKMIKNHLLENAILQYSEFIADLIKIMMEELLELFPFFILNALMFVKSQWPSIRGNGALITGLLYSHLISRGGSTEDVQLDTICYRLLQLLNDEDVEVKAKAVQSLSYLFD